jgi:rare lipoprotein A
VPRIGSKQSGIASWYGNPYHGRATASGEIFDMEKLTAAHRDFAFDTWVLVRNIENDRDVIVRINDRGPFVKGRIIDLSHAAGVEIGLDRTGTARVRLQVIPPPKTFDATARFRLQLGAFRDRDTAAELVARLEGLLEPITILQGPRDALWRVAAGAYSTRDQAARAATLLQQKGYESFIIPATPAPLPTPSAP